MEVGLSRIIIAFVFTLCALATCAEDEIKKQIKDTALKYYESENIYDQFSGASSLIDLGEEEPLNLW